MADNEDVLTFYDAMAADYHLIFQDWVQASAQQGHLLDHLIRAHVDESRNPLTVLDCACGIGTQAIGLAKQGGYHIQASDISPQALARAESEAKRAGVSVSFALADMRRLTQTTTGQFDVVMALDNAIPHLLTDQDLHLAARELRAKTRTGGLLLASTRDYDRLLQERPQLTSQHVIPTAGGIRMVFQVWEWQEEQYRVTQFFVVPYGPEWQMRSYTTSYRALLYWLLSTSVREKGRLGLHRQPLSLYHGELSYRNCRGIVLVHSRKHRCRDSKPLGNASHGSLRGLPKTSSAMLL